MVNIWILDRVFRRGFGANADVRNNAFTFEVNTQQQTRYWSRLIIFIRSFRVWVFFFRQLPVEFLLADILSALSISRFLKFSLRQCVPDAFAWLWNNNFVYFTVRPASPHIAVYSMSSQRRINSTSFSFQVCLHIYIPIYSEYTVCTWLIGASVTLEQIIQASIARNITWWDEVLCAPLQRIDQQPRYINGKYWAHLLVRPGHIFRQERLVQKFLPALCRSSSLR